MNKIEYRNYVGEYTYDEISGIFHGEVIDLNDVITFQGTCVSELRDAMANSIDVYLEFCEELGRDPELMINPNEHIG